MPARIASPLVGWRATSRGSASKATAFSSVTSSALKPFGSDDRLGFSPSPCWMYSPKRPLRRVISSPVTGSSPSAFRGLRTRRRENARVLALGIARAADEGAVFADLERQLAFIAERAEARVDPLAARGKDVRPQKLVQAVEYLARAEVFDAGDGAGEIGPEIVQERLPVDLAVRHLVELLFQISGEIVPDVFGEK